MTGVVSPGVAGLQLRGVNFPDPLGVWIGEDVNPDRIGEGTLIYSGCRISGEQTSIGPGSVLGREGPMTVIDCQLGRNVMLHGGYAEGAVFLDGASMGSGAHVRPGTLIEEQAGGAHAVGLKQTVLFPFVTLGSLINFCDVLMAGGTSRKNHSEVGSSYIHFNFTPHQDKATASLVGDVPRGVMLDREPIFLGGQGGLVGPARIEYGTVVAAGSVLREDALEPGRLVVPASPSAGAREYEPGVLGRVARIFENNLHYLGNLHALAAWYEVVRRRFFEGSVDQQACLEGARRQIQAMLKERRKRLNDWVGMLPDSLERVRRSPTPRRDTSVREHEVVLAAWPMVSERLQEGWAGGHEPDRDALMTGLDRVGSEGYLGAVRGLDAEAKVAGTRWLQSMVDSILEPWRH